MARKFIKRQPKSRQLNLPTDCTALYIRVSTERQATEGYSLAAQQERLTKYCESMNWRVCPEHIYIDAGESGTTTDRTQFQAMLAAAHSGLIQRIVAIKLDRLARNVRAFLALVDDLQAVDCDLVLLKESFDTGTPQGKFALTLFAALAELEASTITERVMSGKQQKATEGGYNGSRVPLGYSYAEGTFTPNERAALVQEIFTRFVGGQSFSSLANWLNESDQPTSTGSKWYPASVRYVITNGFYAGIAQWDGVESTGQHQSIISIELYEQAQARIASIKPGPQPKGQQS